MRKIALLVGLFMLAPVAARAQKFEVFAGYSFARFEQMGGDANTSGWQGAFTFKFNTYVGLTGAFTGNYGSLFKESMNIHSYYVGPQLSLPMRYSPFVHVLLGDLRLSLPGLRKNVFSTEVGGGLDIRVNHYLSIRAIEADVVTGDLKATSNDGRISSGIVVHF